MIYKDKWKSGQINFSSLPSPSLWFLSLRRVEFPQLFQLFHCYTWCPRCDQLDSGLGNGKAIHCILFLFGSAMPDMVPLQIQSGATIKSTVKERLYLELIYTQMVVYLHLQILYWEVWMETYHQVLCCSITGTKNGLKVGSVFLSLQTSLTLPGFGWRINTLRKLRGENVSGRS